MGRRAPATSRLPDTIRLQAAAAPRPPASGTSTGGASPRGPGGSRARWRRARWNHDHRRAEVQGRPHLGHHVVGRHLEPAVRHRAAHLPALHQAPRRAAHPRRAQGRPHRPRDREAAVHRPPGRLALVAFQGACAGADVRDRARPGVPLHQVAASDRGRRRGIDLHPSHEGRPLHDAYASGAGQRGRPARRHRHGRPRHQGRPLRVHARQDRHRRPERAVPHAAPHHPADGGHDRAHPEGCHLRPRLRHRRLPRRGLRASRRAPRRPHLQERPCPPPLQRGHLPRLRLRTPPCCASAA